MMFENDGIIQHSVHNNNNNKRAKPTAFSNVQITKNVEGNIIKFLMFNASQPMLQ